MFNPDLRNSPQKIGVWWVARLKFSISLENFKILIFFNLWALRAIFSTFGLLTTQSTQPYKYPAVRKTLRDSELLTFWGFGIGGSPTRLGRLFWDFSGFRGYGLCRWRERSQTSSLHARMRAIEPSLFTLCLRHSKPFIANWGVPSSQKL